MSITLRDQPASRSSLPRSKTKDSEGWTAGSREPGVQMAVGSLGSTSVGIAMRGTKLVSLLALLALAAASAGCNTVKGAGKDVQKAGQAVERAADKAQH